MKEGMVTFKPVGRLGNFLFEAASALVYGWDHNMEVHIPEQTRDAYWHPIYLPHLRNPRFDPMLPCVNVVERTFRHHGREFREEWKSGNIFLQGYWQNEKYFAQARNFILKRFHYPWVGLCGFVSVHVRRGDYLKINKTLPGGEVILKHPPVTPAWYRAQMAKFPGATFQFYSDDIAWCSEEFGFDPNCNFAPSFQMEGSEIYTPEERDLMHMACCEHHICSASTFSWWGAWLNRNFNKRVIFPQHWINPQWGDDDFSDVVPAHWERTE